MIGTHKALEVFPTPSGERTSSFPTKYSTLCLAVSSTQSGATVVAGGDDGALHIYVLGASGDLRETNTLSTAGPQPSSLSFSPSGALLAAGHANGKITVYSTSDWSVAISRWSAHTGKVMGIAWRPDGKYAVSGALDTAVFLWSVDKPGKRVSVGNAHKEGCNGVAWLGASGGQEERVVSVGMDAAVKVWKVDGLE